LVWRIILERGIAHYTDKAHALTKLLRKDAPDVDEDKDEDSQATLDLLEDFDVGSE